MKSDVLKIPPVKLKVEQLSRHSKSITPNSFENELAHTHSFPNCHFVRSSLYCTLIGKKTLALASVSYHSYAILNHLELYSSSISRMEKNSVSINLTAVLICEQKSVSPSLITIE